MPSDDESNLNTDAYIGVDPIYQNSASVANRPYTPEAQADEFKAFKDDQPVGPWTHSAEEIKAAEDGTEIEEDDENEDLEDEEPEVPQDPEPAPKQVARPVRK